MIIKIQKTENHISGYQQGPRGLSTDHFPEQAQNPYGSSVVIYSCTQDQSFVKYFRKSNRDFEKSGPFQAGLARHDIFTPGTRIKQHISKIHSLDIFAKNYQKSIFVQIDKDSNPCLHNLLKTIAFGATLTKKITADMQITSGSYHVEYINKIMKIRIEKFLNYNYSTYVPPTNIRQRIPGPHDMTVKIIQRLSGIRSTEKIIQRILNIFEYSFTYLDSRVADHGIPKYLEVMQPPYQQIMAAKSIEHATMPSSQFHYSCPHIAELKTENPGGTEPPNDASTNMYQRFDEINFLIYFGFPWHTPGLLRHKLWK